MKVVCFVLSLLLICPTLLFAAPSSVVFEVAGIGLDVEGGGFSLTPSASLIAGTNYKLLVVARDVDGDAAEQRVNNITLPSE